MAENDHMGWERGYDLYRVRNTVTTDQEGDKVIEHFEACNPKNNEVVLKNADLDELRKAVGGLPQAYVVTDDYIIELTHDRGTPRDIVVNVFDANGTDLKRGGKLPWAANRLQVKEWLKAKEIDVEPEVFDDIVTICRIPPTLKPKS